MSHDRWPIVQTCKPCLNIAQWAGPLFNSDYWKIFDQKKIFFKKLAVQLLCCTLFYSVHYIVKHGLHDCASVAFFRSRAQESPGIHVSHLDTWTKPPQQSTLLLDTGGGSRGACGMWTVSTVPNRRSVFFSCSNKDSSLSSLLRLSVNTEA